MMAKTTPYPSCHRDNYLAKVPGYVAGWLRRVTLTKLYRRAVRFKANSAVYHDSQPASKSLANAKHMLFAQAALFLEYLITLINILSN